MLRIPVSIFRDCPNDRLCMGNRLQTRAFAQHYKGCGLKHNPLSSVFQVLCCLERGEGLLRRLAARELFEELMNQWTGICFQIHFIGIVQIKCDDAFQITIQTERQDFGIGIVNDNAFVACPFEITFECTSSGYFGHSA